MPARDRTTPLVLPFMGPFYERIAEPLALLGLRLAVGALLVIEGWPKITAPFAMAGFVENIGLHPGWLWSAVLAAMQFIGGLMILAGVLTRPAALVNGAMLAVTLWFHMSHSYGEAILSPEGMATLAENGAMFTADGLRNLAADGGAAFLHQVQFKAEGLSTLWTVAAFLLAAFGAGPVSVDRALLKREF